KRGTGVGAESTHNIPDTHKSSVYLYRIREETTARDRWTAKTYLWQRVSDRWSARSEINYSSDESFNESYFGESWKPVEREINSNVFIARQSTVSHTSIGVGRKQVYNPATGNYLNARTEAPSISYVRYRSREYLGFYPEYSLGYSHVSSGHEAPYLSRFSAATSATAQKQMGRGFVASPFLGASEEYSESEPGKFYLYGKYFAGSGMRWYWTRFSFLDLNYRYAQRFRVDSFDLDSEGIEDNSLGATIFTFPTRAALWKVASGYDFLRKEPRALYNEINFSGSGHSLFLNLRHNLVTPAYESALLAWAYRNTLALNAYHNAASKETVGLGASVGFPVGDKNKISAQYVGNLVEGEMKPLARQVKFERDLHCWDAWILYRRRETASREPVEEVFFNLALKMGDIPSVRKREIEKEFYPWRGR
ncbi:MAG: hypothetical protein QME32_03080, partial [Endomicrobiia bacterium]|nr:hypothetical protein [Endomicrobiia bacterium]